MTEDHTLADGAIEQAEVSRKITIEEVDDILGATLDGRYEVLTRLGQGGMGFVYEARDLALGGAPVVLKTLRPELVNNEKTAERFTREAMAQARIDHPHVIKVTGYGVNQDHGAYYVMERLVGGDLGELLDNHAGPVPLERVLDIAGQVASALGAAHARSIVHRDLKPENIFITEIDGKDFVKVLDFGLARLLDAGNKLTETGAVIGTPRYMAPEQCLGERVDARADIYALGLVLHEMLTERQPYQGLGTYEILGKKMLDDMPAPSQLDPPVPMDPRVEAFVMRLLSRVPEARPLDGSQLGEAIRKLREDLKTPLAYVPALPVRATPAPVTPPTNLSSAPAELAMAPKRSSRRPLIVSVLALIALLGLGAAGAAAWLYRAQPVPAAAALPASLPVPEVVEAPTPVVPADTIVHVRTEPAGASVRHGERDFGVTPLDLRIPTDVAEGDPLELSLEGYQARTINVSAEVPTAHVRLHDGP